MTQILGPIALRGATDIASNLLSNRTRRFSNTAAGRRLTRVSEEGTITPRQRRLFASRAASLEADQAGRRRDAISGRLANQGLERSVAGVRALDEPGADVQRGRRAANIELELLNEQSKVDAANELAIRETESVNQRRAERAQRRQGIVGAIGGSLASGLIAQGDAKRLAAATAISEEQARSAILANESLAVLRLEQQAQIAEAMNAQREIRDAFGTIPPGDLLGFMERVLTSPNTSPDMSDFLTGLLQGIMENQ